MPDAGPYYAEFSGCKDSSGGSGKPGRTFRRSLAGKQKRGEIKQIIPISGKTLCKQHKYLLQPVKNQIKAGKGLDNENENR